MPAHVLIVDDDFHTRLILGTHIRRMGYQVSEAADGQAALDLLSGGAQPPSAAVDVIISDVWMPGMSGIELLKIVHERYPDLPVALISARVTLDSSLEAINFGAFAYLTKPFRAEEVQKVIARGVQRAEEVRFRRHLAEHSEKLAALEMQLNMIQATHAPLIGQSEAPTNASPTPAPGAPLSAQNMLTDLMIGLRHELGNMATAIKLNLEVIRDRRNIPDDLRENLEDLQASADDLISLLTRFKEYPQPGSLNQVIDLREVVTAAVDVARGRELTERVRIDLNIRDEGVCIHGAAPELSRAILNLIENAVEATGRARGRVQIGLAGVENTALLTIEDEGPGFAAEVLERVFSPSYTTKVEDGFVRGLGLGLFITRMVISLHGGQIVLENRPEGGARVTVRLPLVLTNADSAPTAA